MFSNLFAFLQKIGKSLMLPVAGLLLGIGAAQFHWLPPIVSLVMKEAGDVIFTNLPLIFAIGVALGFTDNNGVCATAATIYGFVERLLIPFGLHPVRGQRHPGHLRPWPTENWT